MLLQLVAMGTEFVVLEGKLFLDDFLAVPLLLPQLSVQLDFFGIGRRNSHFFALDLGKSALSAVVIEF